MVAGLIYLLFFGLRLVVNGLIWVAIAVAITGLVWMIVTALIRKRVAREAPGHGFTLADIREMHERGDIDVEEFERAKARVVLNTRSQRVAPDRD